MAPSDAASVRTALRAAMTKAMKHRDRVATAVYRTALAAIDNAEAAPVGDDQWAGAIELSAVGVGKTDAQRRWLSEQRMVEIVRTEAQTAAAAAAVVADTNPDVARQLRRQASLLDALLVDT